MDGSDSSLDKEYEKLNEAIMKAIITSDEIKELLQEYQSKDMIQHMAVLNLVLSLEELSEVILSNCETYDLECVDDKENSSQSTQSKSKDTGKKYFVDGKNLTQNEILFERFCQGKFDEQAWLKKIKVKI
jgi:hypothetical protein